MSDNIVEQILDDSYDESRENGYVAMVREFCSRRMRWVAVLVWAFAIVFFAGATYCGIRFVYADTLPDNSAMKGLARKFGIQLEPSSEAHRLRGTLKL